ncbi:glycosyltransferase family 2 protein [candidate division CSSED10-310 bacterium]|uniref:Glycosyltransferase family 2 protein n=1 Tax=candidate division CSSED10-310 bacterium TaxID=2855610 RepID=A0ABV6Z2A5_UNCC1
MDLSIVIPAYNEADNLQELITTLYEVLKTKHSFEVIVVDDGSTDASYDLLKQLRTQYQNLKVVKFRTNFGQTAALSAGFKHACGDIIVTLDADLQNDPHDIPMLLQKMDQNYDVVSGWRKNRQDPFLKRRLPSIIANWFISKITGVHLHDYGCTLKAYRKETLENFELYGELHRFIPALTQWSGASITEVPVNHFPRRRGKSNYGLGRTYRVILDLITVKFLMSFSTQPIHIFGAIGLVNLLLGFLCLGIVIFLKLYVDFNMTGNPLLYASILFIFTATQLIMMGLLAEISIRTYHETLNKPIYVIDCVLD